MSFHRPNSSPFEGNFQFPTGSSPEIPVVTGSFPQSTPVPTEIFDVTDASDPVTGGGQSDSPTDSESTGGGQSDSPSGQADGNTTGGGQSDSPSGQTGLATGGGQSDSPTQPEPDRGNMSEILERVTRETAATSVICDDEEGPGLVIIRDASTAVPLVLFQRTAPSDEFLFDQFTQIPAKLTIIEDPEWFTDHLKHNKMIPAQYYFDSLIKMPYDVRTPTEQRIIVTNLGINSGPEFYDDLRYAIGCTWEHSTLRTGNPTTALGIANEFEKYDPESKDFFDALARRGIYFYLETEEGSPISKNREIFGSNKHIKAKTGLVAEESGYTSKVVLLTNMTMLQQMRRSNSPPSMDAGHIDNIFTHIDSLTSRPGIEFDLYEHTFRGATGFNPLEQTADRYSAQSIGLDLVQITTHSRTPLENPDQFYPKSYKIENQVPSIYRKYTQEFGKFDRVPIFDEEGNTILFSIKTYNGVDTENQLIISDVEPGLRLTRDDKIQKFPCSEVVKINQIAKEFFGLAATNDAFNLFENQEDPLPYDFWLNANLSEFNLIQIKMGRPSPLAGLLADTGLDTLFLELLDMTYPNNETFFVQILDTIINSGIDQNAADNSKSDLAAINLRPNEVRSPIFAMKEMLAERQFDDIGQQFDSLLIDNYSYPLGYDGVTTNVIENNENGFQRSLFSNFFNKIPNQDNMIEAKEFNFNNNISFEENYTEMYLNPQTEQHRVASQILSGQRAYSEILAYRLVKIDSSTSQVVQEFYFMNTNSQEFLNFIDSQVLPNKTYTYKIFTINYVSGSRYKYDLSNAMFLVDGVEMRDKPFNSTTGFEISPGTFDPAGPFFVSSEGRSLEAGKESTISIKFDMNIVPSIRIIESPYYEQQIVTISSDRPPLSPAVQVANSFRASDNESAVMIIPTTRVGHVVESPRPMMKADESELFNMLANQSRINDIPNGIRGFGLELEDLEVEYRTDSEAEQYQMFFMFSAPSGYSSFASEGFVTTTPQHQKFFDVDLPFNTKIYTCFRAIDKAGFSNPTPIYVLTRHNYGDGTYTTFETYEPEYNAPFICCSRAFSIEPSFEQSVIEMKTEDGESKLGKRLGTTSKPAPPGSLLGNLTPADPEKKAALKLTNQNEAAPDVFDTAPHLESVSLGRERDDMDLVWNRKFKFRFTSVDSYNSFDINCSFSFDKLIIQKEDLPDFGPSVKESKNPIDRDRKNRRSKNNNKSNMKVGKDPRHRDDIVIPDKEQTISNEKPATGGSGEDKVEKLVVLGDTSDKDNGDDKTKTVGSDGKPATSPKPASSNGPVEISGTPHAVNEALEIHTDQEK